MYFTYIYILTNYNQNLILECDEKRIASPLREERAEVAKHKNKTYIHIYIQKYILQNIGNILTVHSSK